MLPGGIEYHGVLVFRIINSNMSVGFWMVEIEGGDLLLK